VQKEGRMYDTTGSALRSGSPSDKKFGRKSMLIEDEKRQLEERLRQKEAEIEKL
jgi:hypothetical protein